MSLLDFLRRVYYHPPTVEIITRENRFSDADEEGGLRIVPSAFWESDDDTLARLQQAEEAGLIRVQASVSGETTLGYYTLTDASMERVRDAQVVTILWQWKDDVHVATSVEELLLKLAEDLRTVYVGDLDKLTLKFQTQVIDKKREAAPVGTSRGFWLDRSITH